MHHAISSPASGVATAPAREHPTQARLPAQRQIHTDPHARTLHAAAGPSGQPANDSVRPVGRVGILGANGMGIGIALALAAADMPATLFDRRDALDQGLALFRAAHLEAFARGELTAQQRDRRLALFAASARLHHLKDCDLIIDTTSIDAPGREKLFRYLDEIGKPDSIFVANATGSCLDRIARITRRPADLLGLCCTDSTDLSGTARLVRGRETSEEAFATTAGLLADIGKS